MTGPTHEAGHTLDVVITNSCHVIKFDADPPIYADHSLISAVIPLQDATYFDTSASRTITKRYWKQLDIAAFKQDLIASDIVIQPIVECDNFFDTYDRCLRTLVDKHAPLAQKTVRARSTAPWYSYHCRLIKARRLEKAYRHTRTEIAYRDWRHQSMLQLSVF